MMIARGTRRLAEMLGIAVLFSACAAFAQDKKATLDALNTSSAKFTSAQASFKQDFLTAAVHDHDLTEGIQYAIHKGGSSEVGIKIVGNGARTAVFKNGTARVYNPGNNCYDSYSVSNNKGTIDSVLALSFGASGKDLDANWNITDKGPEKMDSDGKSVAVEHLDLVPKDLSLTKNFSHVELWVDTARAISLKQIMYFPNNDTRTEIYSNIKLNGKVDTGPFEIKGKPCSK